jgi:hypothetical protein
MRLQQIEIKTDVMTLLADQMEFNSTTGEASALGNVPIKVAK